MTTFSQSVEAQKIDIKVYLRCAIGDIEDAVKKYKELRAAPNYCDTPPDKEDIRAQIDRIAQLFKELPQ